MSRATGRAPSYLSATLSRGSDLQAGTLARIAAACGCRVDVVDASTGERVGTVDAPD